MIKKLKLNKSIVDSLCVAIITLASQVLGYIREMIFAFYLGTDNHLGAFQVAETVPLLFTQIIISSIPLALTPVIITERLNGNRKIINTAINLCAIVMLLITILVWMFPRQLLSLVAPGFSGDQLMLTCRLVIILAPNIFNLSVMSVMNSFLNSKEKFIIPASIGLILNAGIILAQIISGCNVVVVAFGSAFSSLVMLALTTWFCCKEDDFRILVTRFSGSDLKLIISKLLPVLLIAGMTSLNLALDKAWASLMGEGAVSLISYSSKIINIPIFLFSTAVVKVMMPKLTVLNIADSISEIKKIILYIFILCLVGQVVCVVFFNFFGEIVVRVLFGRGAFNDMAVRECVSLLKIYSFGVLAIAIVPFFQSVYYTRNSFMIPLILSVLQIMIYIIYILFNIGYNGAKTIVVGNVVAYNCILIIYLLLIRSYENKKFS